MRSGNQNTPVSNYFHGTIDDVLIYTRALSEAEIQALYREGGWASESNLSWPGPSSNRATLNTDAFKPGLPPMLLPANRPAGDCTGSQNRV